MRRGLNVRKEGRKSDLDLKKAERIPLRCSIELEIER